jgi:glucan phosphorylase
MKPSRKSRPQEEVEDIRTGLSVARVGKFSADRAIREYYEEIWQV